MNTLLEGAGIFIWPLGVCSILVVFLLLERALALLPSKVAPEPMLKLVREGRAKELNSEAADSAAGRLVLRWKEGATGEVLKAYARAELVRLQRGFFLIDSIVAAAPLLGLLGTVTGIMNTFTLMTVFGTGDVKTLSSGISEALITTEYGLIVAIPSLLIHSFLSRKAKSITDEMDKAAIVFGNEVARMKLKSTSKAA